MVKHREVFKPLEESGDFFYIFVIEYYFEFTKIVYEDRGIKPSTDFKNSFDGDLSVNFSTNVFTPR